MTTELPVTVIHQIALEGSAYREEAARIDQANNSLVDSSEQVTIAQEKITRATLTSSESFARFMAKIDPLFAATQKLKNQTDQLERFQREGTAGDDEIFKAREIVRDTHEKKIEAHNQRMQALREQEARIAAQPMEQFNQLRARHDPLFRLEQERKEELAKIAQSESHGVGSASDYEKIRVSATQHYDREIETVKKRIAKEQELANATNQTTTAIRLQSYQLINLSNQVQDVFVGLAGGQHFGTVMVQQVPQAVMAVGGFRNALTLLAAAITPVTIGATALAAAAVAGGVAWYQYSSEVKAMDASLRLIGDRIGMTREQIIQFNLSQAEASNTSIGQTKDMTKSYLAMGATSEEVLKKLTGVTRDFAAATGTDIEEATQKLGASLKDPAKFAKDLSEQYGLLTFAQLRDIELAGTQAEKNKLLAQTLDQLQQKLKGTADASEGMWDKISRFASNSWNKFKDSSNTSLEENYAELTKAQLNAKHPDKVLYLQEQIRHQEEARAANEINRKEMEQRQTNIASGYTALALDPLAQQREKYQQQLKLLGKLTGEDTEEQKKRAEAIERVTNALEGLVSETDRHLEQLKIQAKAATLPEWERGMFMAVENAKLSMKGKLLTNAEEKAIPAAQLGLVAAQQEGKGLDALRQSQIDRESAGQLLDAEFKGAAAVRERVIYLNQEALLRNHVSQSTAENVSAELRMINALRDKQELVKQDRTQAQSIALLEKELSLVGMIPAERERELEILKRRHQYENMGLGPIEEALKERESSIAKMAELKAKLSAMNTVTSSIASGVDEYSSATQLADAEERGAAAVRERTILLAEEKAIRDLIRAGIQEDDARAMAAIQATQQRWTAQQRDRQSMDQKDRQTGNELERLKQEVSLVGALPATREKELALLSLRQQLMDMGVSNIEEELQKRGEILGEIAKQRELLNSLNRYQQMIGDTLADSLMNGFSKGEDMAEAFKNTLITMFKGAVLQPLLQPIVSPLASGASMLQSVLGNFVGKTLENAFGGSGLTGQSAGDYSPSVMNEWSGNLPARAGGGPVDAGQIYLVGEKGPEIFKPGSSGSIIPNGKPLQFSGGGSPPPIVKVEIHIHEAQGAKATVNHSTTPSGMPKIDVFIEMVETALAGSIARGTGALPQALQDRYGLNPAVGVI